MVTGFVIQYLQLKLKKFLLPQFLLIFRKAQAGELVEESGLSKLAKLTEISVEEVGVGGAKNFFEAKVFGIFTFHFVLLAF